MGIYSNSASFMQLVVSGELPSASRFEFLSQALTGRAFNAIDETNDERSEGWVRTDLTDNNLFDIPGAFMRGEYLFFSYRRDQRKIPGSALKSHIAKAEREYLEKRPELKRVPKREREEIKDRVRLQLLAKTVPSQTVIDMVWDVNTGRALIFTASAKEVDLVCELFNKTFENMRLQAISPYDRVKNLVSADLQNSLAAENQATSEALVDLVNSNTWLGQDFLAWLLFSGLNGGQFKVAADGTLDKGMAFSAWIDTKIQLQGAGEGGPQKVVCSGSQDKYVEAKAAMNIGKNISGATVYLEHEENQWKFSLDAEYFAFRSFKCPAVKIEREGVEEASEREGAFYEKLYLIGYGSQLLDSLLIDFATARLTPSWPNIKASMLSWLDGEE